MADTVVMVICPTLMGVGPNRIGWPVIGSNPQDVVGIAKFSSLATVYRGRMYPVGTRKKFLHVLADTSV
ncbi:hypothetical protein M5689_024522 [Euphorbia peplus]|nr:hypothetical protein M5689_024522 [Euphorbia peplus]